MAVTDSAIPGFNRGLDGIVTEIDITDIPDTLDMGLTYLLLKEKAQGMFETSIASNSIPTNAIAKLGESEANKLNTAAAKVGKDIANINGNRNSIRRVASLKHPMAVVSWGVASEQYLSIDFTTSADRYGAGHSNVFSFILKSQQTDTSAINKHTAGTVQMYDIYYILSMHIPPSEITYTYGKEITKNRARGVWVNEHWGDAMLSIECSGQSGVFFRQDTGLTRTYAKYTYGHYELMQMLQLYRNNGMSFDPTYGVVDTISEVILMYDNKIYRGSFDSFNIRESADKPYNFEYDFVFVARGDESARVTGHFVDVKEEGEGQVSTPRLRDIAPKIDNGKGQMVVDPKIIDTLDEPRDASDFDPKIQEELKKRYAEYAAKAYADPPPPKPEAEPPKPPSNSTPVPPGKSNVTQAAPSIVASVKALDGTSVVSKMNKVNGAARDTVINAQKISASGGTKNIVFVQGLEKQSVLLDHIKPGVKSLNNTLFTVVGADDSLTSGYSQSGGPATINNIGEKTKKTGTVQLGVKSYGSNILAVYSGGGYEGFLAFAAKPNSYSKLVLIDATYNTYIVTASKVGNTTVYTPSPQWVALSPANKAKVVAYFLPASHTEPYIPPGCAKINGLTAFGNNTTHETLPGKVLPTL